MTTVTVSANAYDARTDESGCAPDGCTPELTRDGDLTDLSRWSCSAGLVEAGGGVAGEECQIVYDFSEAQVVHSVAISFYKGDTRTRSLNINVNGDIHSVIESSGTTAGLETFELEAAASSSSGAQSVLSLGLESVGLTTDEFLSIIEVRKVMPWVYICLRHHSPVRFTSLEYCLGTLSRAQGRGKPVWQTKIIMANPIHVGGVSTSPNSHSAHIARNTLPVSHRTSAPSLCAG